MTDQRFRLLLLTYLVFAFASIGIEFVPGLVPDTLLDSLAELPDPFIIANPWLLWGVAVPLVVAAIVGFVGLFLLRSWGRWISACTTIVGFAIYPLFGPTVSSGIGSTLLEVSTTLWGAILACAYVSPVSARFASAR